MQGLCVWGVFGWGVRCMCVWGLCVGMWGRFVYGGLLMDSVLPCLKFADKTQLCDEHGRALQLYLWKQRLAGRRNRHFT